MLVQLTINDFAIIESLSVAFSEGLNILSGETGAGKSIIVDAVNLILGARASPDLVRTGADKAVVEALFHLPQGPLLSSTLDEMGIPFEDEVLIKRAISKEGKSRVWINGSPATVQMIAKLGPHLISISGQNEHQLLLRPENQLYILDDFGDVARDRLRLNELYRDYQGLRERREALKARLQKDEQQRELARFQAKEIEEAGLVPGEDADLEAERSRLIHAERLMDVVFGSYQALYEKDESLISLLSALIKNMDKAVEIDRDLEQYRGQLESAQAQLEDVSLALRDYRSRIRIDPDRLEKVQERLQLIRNLKRKYGSSIEEILAYREDLVNRESQLTNEKKDLDRIASLAEEKKRECISRAKELSRQRRAIAKAFERKVEEELKALDMGGTRFTVEFGPEGSPDSDLSPDGFDTVDFMISPNVGEELRPLAKIASGGELSRMMLALKTILARSVMVETLVFDEIDSGIGGATAAKVGEKLKGLAEFHQILGITHLPQIASCGEAHFLVEKEVQQGRTRTSITSLDAERRLHEIARLMGGKTISEKTLAHAREMLISNSG
ncbi:MAG: DNA repair protein RecN [Thermodesulfobacteriota bacterium]